MTITEFINARLDEAMTRRQRPNPICPCGAPTEPQLDFDCEGLIGFRHPIDPPAVFFDDADAGIAKRSPVGFMRHDFYPSAPMYESAVERAFEPRADNPEYAALRAVVELASEVDYMADTIYQEFSEYPAHDGDTFRKHIAAIWAQHPDFESEWA